MTKREETVHAAIQVRDLAYCPYSKHAVGAAVLGEDDKIYSACNVENASYGLTICAERNAIGTMLSNGCKKWKMIAVASPKGAFPCGACLQVLQEFASENAAVILVDSDRKISTFSLSELLPHPFSP
ncbi:MAG TPA: cytidine deaminase [Fimbriimonadales bacterium]|nr:cytidine deaminase [Fimbriimonadales bacterium]